MTLPPPVPQAAPAPRPYVFSRGSLRKHQQTFNFLFLLFQIIFSVKLLVFISPLEADAH